MMRAYSCSSIVCAGGRVVVLHCHLRVRTFAKMYLSWTYQHISVAGVAQA